MIDLPSLVRAAERMNTLCLRAAFSNEPDDRRRALVTEFNALATSLGKLTSGCNRPDWSEVPGQVSMLLVESVKADEARVGTMVPAGHISVLNVRLIMLANAFGLKLEDAATAPEDTITRPEDEPARAWAEGFSEAAE